MITPQAHSKGIAPPPKRTRRVWSGKLVAASRHARQQHPVRAKNDRVIRRDDGLRTETRERRAQ